MKANDPTNAYLARHELGHALVLPTPAYPPQMKKKWDEIFGNQRSAYVGELYNNKDIMMNYNLSGPVQYFTGGD